jgi:4-amino-4-deoxy-L-arabinose transferase-like glycosyltransferase
VFWSICKTKLPHYLLPAYPALALLTACFVDRWMSAAEAAKEAKTALTFPPPWAIRNAWISTILVGIGIMVAVPLATDKYQYLFGEVAMGRLGLLGLLLALGGIWCWCKTMHEKHEEAAIVFAITAVAFLTAVFGLAAKQIDPLQNAKPMMKAICDDEKSILHPVSPIATYGLFRESTVFYAGKPVTKCQNNETTGRTAKQMLADFLAKPGRSYVIMTAEDAAKVEKMFPGELKEIHRKSRFLADGEMVVLRHAG